ncbi:hypothetical protein D7D52_15875 [Nocardia yunnanensis]|uniref:Uncharacterized protein n=1 Tax=Nocardia yunnanensis TaxID=2382165 RepID=A0A386ZC67_9NOCA|nr:hypothetical protein [Nocardia yunnanensis]AYF75096.1 hypothetical protein D7D52_15875 [Nocardia yunnanensis]
MYGDEFHPAPECIEEHDERTFLNELTFADAEAILAMLHELSPNIADGFLPVWIRNLAYRLAVLQRPDDPAVLREAADSLYMFGPECDGIAADLRQRADELEGR